MDTPSITEQEGTQNPSTSSKPTPRHLLRDIASSTLKVIEEGHFQLGDVIFEVKDTIEHMIEETHENVGPFNPIEISQIDTFGASDSHSRPMITVSECSTLVGARELCDILGSVPPILNTDGKTARIGVLNFASAKNPGGGFLKGAEAQEESIARASSIHASLVSSVSQPFFRLHKKDPKGGYYTHSMLYIPRVLLFRSDTGDWLPPIEVDVVSCAAVNAGVVRRRLRESHEPEVEEALKAATEQDITEKMKDRMGRILYVFEQHKIRNLVLGSFGTGVFRNKVETVAGIWKHLLVGDGARFRHSFDRVVFAVLGHATFQTFKDTFSVEEKEKTKTGEK